MKETVQERNRHPYSLHDAYIKKIRLHGETLTIYFKEGIYLPKGDDCEQIPGYIEFQGIDTDFSDIVILKDKGGTKNHFHGKTYSLKKFIKKHPKVSMEIIDETYGGYQTVYQGFFYKKKTPHRFIMNITHFGSMKYITSE